MIGLEPITCWLQISCSANWATSAFILLTPTGFEPMFSPWEGDVLTTWPRSHKFIFSVFRIRRFRKTNSPSWARTNNPSVNSRMLYHWAIEEYLKVIHTFKTTYSLYKYQSDCFKFLTLPCFWMNHTMDTSKNVLHSPRLDKLATD